MSLNWHNVKLKNYIYPILIGTIFLIGIVLRLKFYITNYPLWHDECSLAMSIINKNIWEYFGLLDYNQSAPPIFMMITKLFANMFGIKEFVLRILPFICGIASIPVFYYFSKMFLDKKFALVIVNFLFAINYHLIHYSLEFKQYSSDVLLFMLCCILCSKVDLKNISLNKFILLTGIFTIAPMISIPTVFVILGFLIHQIVLHKKEILKNILIVSGITFSIWAIYAFSTLLPQKFIMDGLYYWENSFITFNLKSLLGLIRINLLYYLHPNKFILFDLILLITGLCFLLKDFKNKSSAILSLSLFFIAITSYLRQYPIFERVSLYLIPVILVLLIIPINKISLSKKFLCIMFVFMTLAGLSSYNLSYFKGFSNQDLFHRNNARGAMQDLIKHYENHENYIIVNSASKSEFNYYKKYFDFYPEKVLIVQTPNYSESEYLKSLDVLPSNNDYWFYYAYDYSHSPVIPFLKEYSKRYTVRYENTIGGSYLLNLHK